MRVSEWLRPLALWGLLAAACAASWMKSDLTSNDFERFADLRLTVTFFLLFLGLCALYLDQVGRAAPPPARLRWVIWLALLLPVVAMFPVGSKDVFAYSFHAKMWAARGMNPYLEPSSALTGDEWLRFLQVWWADYPAPYGPLALEQGRALYALAGTTLTAMVAAFKLYNVCLIPLCAWLIAALVRQAGDDADGGARAATLWLWSPLVLFEGVGNAHNDVTMTVLLLAALVLQLRRRWLLSLGLLVLAFWYKWYSVVMLPAWLAYQWRWQRAALAPRNLARAALVGIGVSVLVLAPFAGSVTALAQRVFLHENIFRIFPSELPPPLWVLFRILEGAGLMTATSGVALFNGVRFLLLAATLTWVVARRHDGLCPARAQVEDWFWSLLAFLCLGVTILWPWHLLAAIAFALASGEERLRAAAALLTVLGLLSYFLTFSVALAMCMAIAAALWALRRGGGAAAAEASR